MASRHLSTPRPASSPDTAQAGRAESEQTRSVPAADVLELLGDEYTRTVLEALIEEPRTCREVVEAAGVSKPTAYRRLEKLQEAGFVETSQRLDPDGHHCKQFHAVIEELDFELGQDGFSATVQTSSGGSSWDHGPDSVVGHTATDD